jgi:hypothetical protein
VGHQLDGRPVLERARAADPDDLRQQLVERFEALAQVGQVGERRDHPGRRHARQAVARQQGGVRAVGLELAQLGHHLPVTVAQVVDPPVDGVGRWAHRAVPCWNSAKLATWSA